MTQHHAAHILRRPQVEARTGLSRSAIYALKARGEFPQPVKLTPSGRAVGWTSTSIDLFIASRVPTGASRG